MLQPTVYSKAHHKLGNVEHCNSCMQHFLFDLSCYTCNIVWWAYLNIIKITYYHCTSIDYRVVNY